MPSATPGRGSPRTITARGLARSFRGTRAVVPFDLELGPGGIVGLLGPNGSGKSTFLRMLIGLVRPDQGTAEVDGVALSRDGREVRERCAYAPGELRLYGELRAGEQLDWFLRGRERAARTRARALAAELGLPLEKRVRAYSHGMKRQLVLCAALAPDVGVRLLDEPTEGLDPSVRGRVLALLEEDAGRGTLILLSSHHLGEVDRACGRIVFLARGAKLADESAAVLAKRAERLVRFAFATPEDAARVAAELERRSAPRGSLRVRAEGARLLLEVADGDPLAAIVELCGASALPRPRGVEYGELSLAELYRGLYGVEGV